MTPKYYLAELEKYRPGDEFPNVGYVRRMTALLRQGREPADVDAELDWANHGKNDAAGQSWRNLVERDRG